MSKVIHFSSGNKGRRKGSDLEKLLSNPLKLFSSLYRYVSKNFARISHPFLTKPDMREQYNDLSVRFFKCLCKTHPPGTPVAEEAKKEILAEMDRLRNDDLFNFSLYIGLSKFIEERKIGEIKAMGVVEFDGLKISPKPENPIYKYLDEDEKIRRPEEVGVNISEFTEIFKKITILEELNPQILLKKPNRVLMETNDYLRKRISKGFKIAVSPFFTDLEFETESFPADLPDQRTPYTFKKVINFDLAEKALFLLLKRCLDEEINILVLPELTIDEALLISLKEWLRENNREKVSSGSGGLIMVIAGSFHVPDEEDIRNAAPVLNHRGDVLWTQNKYQIFSLSSADIRKNPEIKKILRISDLGGYEKIKSSEGFTAVDTPLGRICVCICLDFFHQDNFEVFRLSGANVFFVPAMSDTNIQFIETSKHLGRTNLAATFISLASFLPQKIEKTASFRYIPSRSQTFEYAFETKGQLLEFYFKYDDENGVL
ncbi:MAG: hypothetical protein C0407_08670 [Desulfobacca sp.]|nr:hypothetical protein [Desulfobacca sp.]